jgi:hypothetical protein
MVHAGAELSLHTQIACSNTTTHNLGRPLDASARYILAPRRGQIEILYIHSECARRIIVHMRLSITNSEARSYNCNARYERLMPVYCGLHLLHLRFDATPAASRGTAMMGSSAYNVR